MAEKTLFIGIGNDGRGDDALGWKFLEQVSSLLKVYVCTEYRYQLQIEDANLVKDFDKILFIDATKKHLQNGFQLEKCQPNSSFSFSTHQIDPGTVMWLCRELYGKIPKAYTMAIEGKQWALHQGISRFASKNLKKALTFVNKMTSLNLIPKN